MTASPADTAFLDCLAETLAGTWPAPLPEDPAATALDALEPRDLIETMLATRIIAAHHATVDSYRRAMQPGVSDADAVRLRNSAIAAARSFDTALRTLEKRRAPAEKLSQSDAQGAPPRHPHQAPSAADAPDQDDLAAFTPEEIAAAEQALDNDPVKLQQAELAKRIPLYRWQDMTMEERRIAYAPSAPPTPAQLAVMAARMIASNRPPPQPTQAGPPASTPA